MGMFRRSKKHEKLTDYLNGYNHIYGSMGSQLEQLSECQEPFDENVQEEMLALLIQADMGMTATRKLLDAVVKDYTDFKLSTTSQAVDCLFYEIDQLYDADHLPPIVINPDHPNVILMVGVNGSGKTTSVAKLAYFYRQQGYTVGTIAADTFRAGAVAQLDSWCQRLDIPCVKGKPDADPASVLVDGCRYYKEHPVQIIIADTAGRLQNKVNLMNELTKMKKVIGREIEGAPQYIWLTVDATTGQNGLSQASQFIAATQVNGVILTKMDGTSRGGIFLAIRDQYNLGVVFMTVGEQPEDLIPFNISDYLNTLIGKKS